MKNDRSHALREKCQKQLLVSVVQYSTNENNNVGTNETKLQERNWKYQMFSERKRLS